LQCTFSKISDEWMKKFLIVNADDYGHTPGVCEGILQAHLNGIVTSTTAMMNRPHAIQALRTAKTHCPRLGLGVHLTLTAGNTLLPSDRIPSLVQPDGTFPCLEDFVSRLERIDPEEVHAEWHAQIEAFITSTGHTPDHLDSHHHASYFTPILFEKMLLLAKEFDCPIRKPFGNTPDSFSEYLPTSLAGKSEIGIIELFDRYKPGTTQVFLAGFFDRGATFKNLKAILAQIAIDQENDSFELMCHPAVVDDKLREISDYHDIRALELGILQEKELPTLLQQHKIKLVNFSTFKGY
jgi:predicted glycoside hydrolase/deacetylase ChbG (UPF0249 family)